MARKTTKKMLLSLFSSADINVSHLKITALIKKLTAHIDSQRIAHMTEVTQLHHEIDRLTDTLTDEQMFHESTKKLLDNARADFDVRTSRLNATRQHSMALGKEIRDLNIVLARERKGFATQRKKIRDVNAPLHRAFGKINHLLQTLRKKPHIIDYESLVQKINGIILNNSQK